MTPLYALTPDSKIKFNKYYVKRLKQFIRMKHVTNIALSGDYGVGKSSIVGLFRKSLFSIIRRTKVISLVTLSERLENSEEHCMQDDLPSKAEIRKNVQREIFRQLYYSERPGLLRLSRYSRIGKLPVLIYGALIVPCIIVMRVITTQLDFDIWSAGWFALVALLCLCIVLAVLIYCLAVRLESFAQNLSVKGFGAGGLSLSLDSSSPSFEQATDEFIYLFRRTGCKLVILEDLDRFKDPRIYEELRQLNIIINGAKHIHRKVVFVYALRDSLIGDQEQRVKLFDAVVPVTPFMTQDNAFRKIKDVFQESGFTDSEVVATCKVLARYIKDMRAIKAICNAAIVMRDTVGGVNGELRFAEIIAIATIREVFPEEYELIRKGDGELDNLYKACTKKKEEDISRWALMLKKRREVPDNMLLAARKELWRFITSPLSSDKNYIFDSATIAEKPFTQETIDVDFWMKFISEKSVNLDILYKYKPYYASPKKQLRIITIGDDGLPENVRALIELLKYDIAYYETSLEETLRRDVFTYISDDCKTEINLLNELIEIGAIDELYKLYLSPLSDLAGSAELRVFRVKYLNSRTANYTFKLSNQDVEDILEEADMISLQSPTFYNHSIVYWLVVCDDARLDAVLGKGKDASKQLLDFFDNECCLYEEYLSERYEIVAVSGITRVANTLNGQIEDEYIFRLARRMVQLHPADVLRLLFTTTELRDSVGKEAIVIVAVLSLERPESVHFTEEKKAIIDSFLDYYEDTIILNGGALNLAKLRVANNLPTKRLELYYNDGDAEKHLVTHMAFELNGKAITRISEEVIVQKMEKDGISTTALNALIKNNISKAMIEYCFDRPDICDGLTDSATNDALVKKICRYNIKLSKEKIFGLVGVLSDKNLIELLLISGLSWADYEEVFMKMSAPYNAIELGRRPTLRDDDVNRKLVAKLEEFGAVSGVSNEADGLFRLSMKRKL